MTKYEWLNTAAAIIAFSAATLWVHLYTNIPKLAVISAIVAVVGVIVFFLFKFPSETKARQTQQMLWNLFMTKKLTLWILVAIIALEFVLHFFFIGYIQVKSIGDTVDLRVARAEDVAAPSFDWDNVAPHGLASNAPVRDLYLFPCPLAEREYVVKAKGFPDRLVAVPACGNAVRLRHPEDFTKRPVLLLLPTIGVMGAVDANPGMTLRVEIKRGSKPATVHSAAFDGNAMWIACDKDVEVPKSLADQFSGRLGPAETRYGAKWRNPGAVGQGRFELEDGDIVTVQALFDNGQAYGNAQSYTVDGNAEFPQDVEFNGGQ